MVGVCELATAPTMVAMWFLERRRALFRRCRRATARRAAAEREGGWPAGTALSGSKHTATAFVRAVIVDLRAILTDHHRHPLDESAKRAGKFADERKFPA